MTTRGPCIVVTLLGCVLAAAASAHAESAWMLWQQATVFTERWWIPNGWPAHWRNYRDDTGCTVGVSDAR